MSRTSKITAAIATLTFVLGMEVSTQSGAVAGPHENAAAAENVAPATGTEVPEVALASALPDDNPAFGTAIPEPGAERTVRPSARHSPSRPAIPEAPCVIRSRAMTEPSALVRLRVAAVCLPDSRVTVQHNGLLFTTRTDAKGELDLLVPALAERAIFMFTFTGDQMAMAMAEVPAVTEYDRVVLQWQGDAGIRLNAREFGADRGGNLIRLGDRHTPAPRLAEIYTLPAAMSGDGIGLSVEAPVTEGNCGREIPAQTLGSRGGHRSGVRSLVLSIPACDAVDGHVDGHLVLNNLLEDLKIAAR